jgi:putative protease
MSERYLVGDVIHYYGKIGVAGVRLSDQLSVGDHILIIGHTTALEQDVTSLQLNHVQIEAGEPGQEIGLRVIDRVRDGDQVYKLAG